MKFDPQIHHRRSIRLSGYDYSQEGIYFITIVTQSREHLFGEIVGEWMKLNPAGEMVVRFWQKMPEKFSSAALDAFVVMPNHFHGVIVIEPIENPRYAEQTQGIEGQTHGSAPTGSRRSVGADPRVRPKAPISQMVQWFKTMTTNAYIRGAKANDWPAFDGRLWQRNYYEHIIRTAQDRERIINYINTNPGNWMTDEENLSARPTV